MAPRKLSDSDKSALIDLYKQPGQTTTTLAEQFGVSSSTVSRILKSTIPPEEYRELIAQKRMATSDQAESAKKTAKSSGRKATAEKSGRKTRAGAKVVSEDADKTESKSEASGRRRRRRSSNAKSDEDEQLPLLSAETETPEASEPPSKPKPAAPILASVESDEDDDEEDDLLGLDEALGDDFGDDDDLDEEEDDDDFGEVETPKPKLQAKDTMEIMPLGEAVLPKPCYLVVDMRSELITRPLAEFADLGQVPSAEEKSKTLPVFDNHRVARRFSRNKQRVIKVPDGSLITRTSPYLQAKGITRLLVDGQVFDLAATE